LMGEILLARQQPEAALPYLAKAVALDAQALPARAAYGRALLLAGKGAEAIPHLQAALPLDADASLRFQLAQAYRASGQVARAQQITAEVQARRAKANEDQRLIEAEAEITAPAPVGR
jgi:predicted Zn-dependent protease